MIILIFFFSSLFLTANETTNESELVNVEVIKSSNSHDNSDLYLLFKLNIKDHWHTYWRNPGDSGLPTDIRIETQDNVKVSEIIWPQIPKKIPFDDLANFGFSGKQYLLLKVTPDNSKKDINLKAKVSWLVCKEQCIPQDTTLNITIPFGKETKTNEADLIDELLKQTPKLRNLKNAKATLKGEEIYLAFDENLLDESKDIVFFPFEGGIFTNGKKQNINLINNTTIMILPLDEFRIEIPEKLTGIIVYDNKAFEISVDINK